MWLHEEDKTAGENMDTIQNPHQTNWLFGVMIVTALAVAGCSDAANKSKPQDQTPQTPQVQIGSGTIDIPFPPSLSAYSNPNATVVAELRIDNGAPITLAVDMQNKKVTGQTGDIPQGGRTFEITFFVAQGQNKVPIARSVVTVEVGGTVVAINFGSYTYPDSDGDGYTNLVELVQNTAWYDASSKPKLEYPRTSTDYVLFDTPVRDPLDGGNTTVGSAQSAAYVDTAL
jgi:hypothetical protein